MRFDLTEPCSQCPFRRSSCPGWTGPWQPGELLEAIQERPFPCHATISHDGQRIEDDTRQSCAGGAIFLNNARMGSFSGWTRRHHEPAAPGTGRDSQQRLQQLEFLIHHSFKEYERL